MRPNKTIKGKPAFAFVVDGKCEYWYLHMLKNNEKSLKINILPEIYKKKTLDEQYKRVIELTESAKVFWVVDFDVINKETREAKNGKKTVLQEFQKLYRKCQKNDKIIIVVNNPCFEFWVLLHFHYTTRFYENYNSLLPDLHKYLADYEKTEKYFVETTPDIYKRLKDKLQTAIANSKKAGEFDFENIETGMAEMYKIFSELKQKTQANE
ncbi:MAG: RloB family protein [Prevotellaceae bacterium]|jgi:hypothetical protein|nr:RloB family protein [Prevotellaceae bacterium]